ncbi:HTH myb-type domain-containing protein [Mycena chlorophos]|uniref:HTH myb-type domain-containing protein n=1 Tax=Mycena chlorophos TaxID=658473 RepID=A0A8H6T673_MYCCL|nr:HTH myb-type domain-containing protein [Mycena chlorophos]
MTSRVQKGGPVFKPVLKARARATSSVPAATPAPTGRETLAPIEETAPTASSSALPPPPPVVNDPIPAPPPAPVPIPAISRIAAPPLVSKAPTPVLVPPRLASRAPPSVAQSSTPREPASSAATTLVGSSQPAASSSLPSGPSQDLTQVAPSSIPANLDLGNPLKKTRKRKKKDGETGDETTEEASAAPKRKKSKKKDAGTGGDTTGSEIAAPTRKKRKQKASEEDGAETTEGELSAAPKRKRARKKNVEDAEVTEGESSAPTRKRSTRKKTQAAVDIPSDVNELQSDASPKRPRKRKVVRPIVRDSDEEEEEEEVQSDSAPKQSRRKKKPKLPAFDPDADPGEDLDPTVVTMAELCEDSGQGRVSSKAMEIQRNHLAWKQQNKERRARMKVIAERKKYGRPEDPDDEEPAAAAPAAPVDDQPGQDEVVVGPSEPVISEESGNEFDYSKDLTTSRFNVQVRIGPNGETIIDEDSLAVDRTEEVDTSNYVHVVESDNTKFVNSASYTKKCRGSRWSAEETELFYDALAQHGENYELISLVLPGRSRTACKNKFKAEDKKNSARINQCLESRLPIDMNTLTRLTGKDFSGPTPIIKVPSPPPAMDKDADPPIEPETPATVRKRSRSRALSAASAGDGVEIIGDVASYNDLD